MPASNHHVTPNTTSLLSSHILLYRILLQIICWLKNSDSSFASFI